MNKAVVIVENLSTFQISMRIQKVLTRVRKSSQATLFMKEILETTDYSQFLDIASKYVIIKHINISNNSNFSNPTTDNHMSAEDDDDDGDIIK